MLTIYQIFKNVNTLRRKNARYVKFDKFKKGRTKNGDGFIAAQCYTDKLELKDGTIINKPSHNKYITMITFFDQALHCRVACSCYDELFRWETALNMKDAADIEYSNGEMPNITNPTYRAAMCKHSIGLYLKIAPYLPTEQQPR